MRRELPTIAIAAAALLAAACGRARPYDGGAPGAGNSPAVTGCTACHGDASRAVPAGVDALVPAAPPVDTHGNTTTTSAGVGAHQAHLGGGALRGPLACADCHLVPTSTAHANGTVDLTFGALATTAGLAPAFDGAALTCASVYCHGASLQGGSLPAPTWNKVDGSQAACGTCHGLPPPAPHPSVTGGTTACNGCHPATVKADGTIDVAGGKHIDGQVEVNVSGGSGLTCTTCHGDPARLAVAGADALVAAAPPVDAQGFTTSAAVGAHQAHVNKGAGALSTPLACATCHVVPSSTSHANGTVNVTFGGRATSGGATPTWNGGSCAATYCHGRFSGGAAATPSWTGGAMTCTSCHGDAPSTGQHGQHSGRSCSACHGTGYSTSTVNAALHVNGAKNVGGAGSSITRWTPPTSTTPGSCTPTCHSTRSW